MTVRRRANPGSLSLVSRCDTKTIGPEGNVTMQNRGVYSRDREEGRHKAGTRDGPLAARESERNSAEQLGVRGEAEPGARAEPTMRSGTLSPPF